MLRAWFSFFSVFEGKAPLPCYATSPLLPFVSLHSLPNREVIDGVFTDVEIRGNGATGLSVFASSLDMTRLTLTGNGEGGQGGGGNFVGTHGACGCVGWVCVSGVGSVCAGVLCGACVEWGLCVPVYPGGFLLAFPDMLQAHIGPPPPVPSQWWQPESTRGPSPTTQATPLAAG